MVEEEGIRLAMKRRMEVMLLDYVTLVVDSHIRVDVDDDFLKKFTETVNNLYPEMIDTEVVYRANMKIGKDVKKRINDAIKAISLGVTITEDKSLCK